jgi:hypothetical protein
VKSFESWIASIASLLVVAVSATNVALAHGGYSTTWGGTNAPYQFTSSFPGGNGERNSVRQGADQWTDTPNANFTWQELGEVSNWTPSTNCGAEWAQNQSINWKSIDGGGNQSVLADALWCSFNGTIFKYWIRFDKDNAADFFWPGTGAPPVPSGMYDGWAIASHEFGHATGFSGHIGSNTSYCDEGSLDYHTMCQTILAGKARQRTLEVHDVNTFQQSY